jgi:predicted nucleic acid-binding protein
MVAKPFLDTNILIYAAVTVEDTRRERASSLLAAGGIVSVQIMNEFVNVARGKLRRDWREVLGALDDLALLLDPPMAMTMEMHREAVQISRRYGFRIYDSLIVAAAKLSGCRLLYTEDLQHEQVVEGVTIRNPFAPHAL